MASSLNNPQSRTPVYFLGIGGPNFMENRTHPAFLKLGETGREITQKVRPKAIVVISAHWQHSPTSVAVNVREEGQLIYDFYGFPPHYYEHKFPHRGSREIAEKVIKSLEAKGIEVERTERGLDHGVWVGFLAAFDPQENPLYCPIVQLSLMDNYDIDQHYRIGEALQSLRDEGVLIVGAGMVVHNLNDFRKSRGKGPLMPYASTFEMAVTEALREPENRKPAMSSLMQRTDTDEAHPSWEHIMPLHVAAGAAGDDRGERIWAMPEGSLNWGQYRFGSIL
ncbi:putative aromatic ring-opening dioxygenase LigB subunit [Myriangium duriaei CBS 260.36]|uniref:Aromatic ring-opening dioxygenase LigB subunit n=1 Tax=Myriangium duriaei CBS 260.36 TaxID=1168546 RepID=A0A9P4IW74_9PEZI|nr:putative aromatic ring-opening dioxygenase LigB subunit [Myriangium duriaei CBS 260.36]